MLLKELLDSIKLQGRDNIIIWYKSPTDRYTQTITSNRQDYYECDVNSYKVYDDCKWIDPFSGHSGFCKQYSIEIDWDEVRIIKERRRAKRA